MPNKRRQSNSMFSVRDCGRAGCKINTFNRGWLDQSAISLAKNSLTNQCTQIANARFYIDYAPAKKWVIVATLAHPQSRDFKRYNAHRVDEPCLKPKS